jgi:hypothetical protein
MRGRMSLVLALCAISGCGSARQASSTTVAAVQPALTDSSTCEDWAKAGSAEQTAYAQTAQRYMAVPAQFHENATGYTFGAIGGRCRRAEAAGTATTTTLASVLDRPTNVSVATEKAPSYPVVHFSVTTQNPTGSWPFTAQLASIILSPSGTPVSPPLPPSYTYLLVRVNITNLTTDRPVQPPGVSVRCHAPGDGSWHLNGTQEGYDEGSEPPSPSGYNVPMNDGQPHPWDVEWRVPADTSTTEVKCVLLPEKGSLKLN